MGDTLRDPTLTEMAGRILDQAPERFALAGVSMGGMVALELMRLAPQRVSHLALFDTNASPDTVRGRSYRHLANVVVGVANYRRLAERTIGSLVAAGAPADVREELVDMSVRVGARAYVRQNRAVIARADLRPVLPTIRVPTAVIVGEEDRITPVRQSRAIHFLTPGSTLEVVPDCGHLPPIERPELAAALIVALLQRG